MWKSVSVAVVLGLAVPAQAQVPSMFHEQGTPFVAPGRAFSINIPPSWGAALVQGDPDTIQFRNDQLPGHGSLYIRRITVPSGAHPRQILL
ncbi:MAG: hypothetical protein AAFQ82_17115, partial [Myxococcota bacterium]